MNTLTLRQALPRAALLLLGASASVFSVFAQQPVITVSSTQPTAAPGMTHSVITISPPAPIPAGSEVVAVPVTGNDMPPTVPYTAAVYQPPASVTISANPTAVAPVVQPVDFSSITPATTATVAVVATVQQATVSVTPVSPAPTATPVVQGITTLVMGIDDTSIQKIAPVPGSRVRVPLYEQVTLTLPANWTYPVQWQKNGVVIPGATNSSYVIPLATSSDDGNYTLVPQSNFIGTGIRLDVVGQGHLGNLSTRVALPADGSPVIVGFVVDGQVNKNVVVRAVGPSLRQFGITTPAAQPRFKIFNSAGKDVLEGVARPAVQLDWTGIFKSIGAFPLVAATTTESDYADYFTLPPGSYTIHVYESSRTVSGGTALIELYQN